MTDQQRAWIDRQTARTKAAGSHPEFRAFIDGILQNARKQKSVIDRRDDHQRDHDDYQVEIGERPL